MALKVESSSQTSKWKYRVFVSFRGKDTRDGFTEHLYAALQRQRIQTFRENNNEELRTSDQQLLLAIVILSPNYANSTSCLDELRKIVESKGSSGMILPVFYGVDPFDVRHQKGTFAEAFRKHEERFNGNKEKVQKWRDALKFVAQLRGCSSQNRYEAQLIDEIVEEAWTKIESRLPTQDDNNDDDEDDLIAINAKVNEVCSCLSPESTDVLFIGIWGMGGSGKTTLASTVCKKIRTQFEEHCILRVGEVSREGDQGLVNLQNQLLSHLKPKCMVIKTLNQGKDAIKNLLYKKKVLIVLDDVRTTRQLENLAGSRVWFGPGSRIIVTTRDQHLLSSHGVTLFKLYEMKALDTNESLQLFHKEAFKGEKKQEEYLDLSRKFVEYAGGLPLALKVLGSNLCTRSIDEWDEALDKMRKDQDGGIMNILRICYDMLEEGYYKTIFLDIACFFKGWYKDKVIRILKNCGLHPAIGISVLVEKSFITCQKGVLGMHDLLEEMGRMMVMQESKQHLGRSRLSSLDDINQVLKENTIEGVVLKQQIESYNKDILKDHRAFSKMCKLRLLIILCELHLSRGFKFLPSSLKVLIWVECPLKTLPLGLQLRELVHLQMNNSKVEQLWNGSQVFEKLRVVDLSYSSNLIRIPNISNVPLLEELILDCCISLVEVDQSVGQHKKLEVLSLTGCIKLETLPRKFEMSSLKRLILCGCSNVKSLPEFGESMEYLSVLNLMKCSSLLSIPETVTNLKSLKILNLSGCSKICRLPDNINENWALEDLDLSETSIRVVDSSLFQLENLKKLSFRGCSGPVSNTTTSDSSVSRLTLPPRIPGLPSLAIFDLSYCNLHHELIPDLRHLSSLETLILSGNTELILTHSVAKLPMLHFLEAEGCRQSFDPYVLNFHGEAGLLLDLWKLWKLFKTDYNKLLCQVVDHSYPITYQEIPPNFGKEIFFPIGTRFSELESSASITVDIPNECCEGKWWGIAVFLAFKPLESSTNFPSLKFGWSFGASSTDPEVGSSFLYLSSNAVKAHYDCCLVTMIVSENYIYIQLHHRSYDNVSESKPFSKHRKPNFSENSRVRFSVQGEEINMKECGYHVFGNEDFRNKFSFKLNRESTVTPNSSDSNSTEEMDIILEDETETTSLCDDCIDEESKLVSVNSDHMEADIRIKDSTRGRWKKVSSFMTKKCIFGLKGCKPKKRSHKNNV
ncbi:TMV resistance protein N-like isoform X2 [Arachis stenosperma]|uniref:TMV resistance protein N-like isoform X2 n=1 Tax=Arachis stenosperma TaxID=217475 RepID=UPI0025AB650F|nr:TMV resistance protein N-like isoform X2 [Arachis stenosperma]